MAHIATQTWRFGDLAQPAKMLDKTCQVNYLGLGQLSDPLDDFYGAMGEATLKVAVSGLVTPKGPGKAAMAIDELGFYLRDSYDFNDGKNFFLSQPLGFWASEVWKGFIGEVGFPFRSNGRERNKSRS